MAISSLGVGSGILTQDVLDQLRKADEAQRIQPITLNLANENDKKDSLEVIDASMTNLNDSINELKSAILFDERKSTVTGTSVEVTASSNSDLQDFTLDVTQLATKRIEESGTFSNATGAKYDPKIDSIATGSGTIQFDITGLANPIDITVDNQTTLDDLKKAINKQAGDYAQATIVQTADGEFNLFVSSVATGASQDISISDPNSLLTGTELTTGMDAIVGAEGQDSSFKFNGQVITRSSNQVDDLISGYKIKLVEAGSSDVSVQQDRDNIETKIDSFVEKYNSTINELNKQTLSSTDSKVRGIFSGDSSIKSMKRAIQDMIFSVSNDGGRMEDYGFSVDKDGKMSIDKTVFNTKMDDNPKNVEAFFSGGTYTKSDLTTVTLTGAFSSFYDITNSYTKSNGGLDLVKDSLTEGISALEKRKTSATERLDAKYAILKKQYTAYNSMINKFNSSSSIFTQLANQSSSNS